MTVTAVRNDPDALTMTIVAEFDANPDRVWQLWADPRRLERWWGPAPFAASFTRHDLAPGSRVEYQMSGPDGDQIKGYWEVVEVQAPHRLVLREGFANDDGSPNTDLPGSETRVTIEAIADGRTRMSVENIFPSRQAMEEALAMGMDEGWAASINQIDALLAEDRAETQP